MTSICHAPEYILSRRDLLAEHKECSTSSESLQEREHFWGDFSGTIIEGECHRFHQEQRDESTVLSLRAVDLLRKAASRQVDVIGLCLTAEDDRASVSTRGGP